LVDVLVYSGDVVRCNMKYTKKIEALEAGDLVELESQYSDTCWCMLAQISSDKYRLICLDGGNRFSDDEVCGINRRVSIAKLREYLTKKCHLDYKILAVADNNQLHALLNDHLEVDLVEVPRETDSEGN